MKPTLAEHIMAANKENRLAVIPFITAGYPNITEFEHIITALDAEGADIIEIGVPFSDPVADGPVVEAASNIALAQGVTLSSILRYLTTRPPLRAGIVLMGYYNPFLTYGLEEFAHDAAKAHVSGVIVPDLPLEEQHTLRTILNNHDIDLIMLVGPNTSEARMKEYAQCETRNSGFVYVVSLLGTTGNRATIPPEAEETIKRAQNIFSLPVALGFGLQNPKQLDNIQHAPHAAIIGSAFLRHIEQGGDVATFLQPWRHYAINNN